MLRQKIIQNCGYKPSFFQKFLSTVQDVKNPKTVTKRISRLTSRKERPSINEEIYSHLKEANLGCAIDNIPKSMLRRSSLNRTLLYLINRNVAKQISSMISKDLLKNSSYVIECNPGFGLLTQELLDTGIPCINLFEKCENFFLPDSPLETLFIKYKSRVQLTKLNFANIWMSLLRDQHTNELFGQQYLVDVPYRSWQEESFAQIIVTCQGRSFLTLLIHNFFNQTSIFDHGRPTFFITMSSPIWERLVSKNESDQKARYYSQYSVMLHLFFDINLLGTVPRKAFLPWPPEKANQHTDDLNIPMVVIKLEPKKKTFNMLTKEDLRAFWYFLKSNMRSRKQKVIAEFEKFVPGCGPRLIELNRGIDICTAFKELPPDTLLEIFKNFRLWPEYDENLFVPTLMCGDEEKKEDEEKICPEDEHEQQPAVINPSSADVVNEEKTR